MIEALEQYTVADLIAAVEAKQLAQSHAAQARDQQVMRDCAVQVAADRHLARFNRQNQTPVQWATLLAEAGVPVTAAKIFCEVLAIIFNRLQAVEETQKQPPHLQGVERRG